jgi:hypothetical protein
MTEVAKSGVKNKVSTNFIERIAKLPAQEGFSKKS